MAAEGRGEPKGGIELARNCRTTRSHNSGSAVGGAMGFRTTPAVLRRSLWQPTQYWLIAAVASRRASGACVRPVGTSSKLRTIAAASGASVFKTLPLYNFRSGNDILELVRLFRQPPRLAQLWLIPFAPFFLVLLVAAGLSIPIAKIQRLVIRRREKQFASTMEAAGKSTSWADAVEDVERGRGTLISEVEGYKGPWRLWWTPDDIPAISPYRSHFDSERLSSIQGHDDFLAFSDWCRKRYIAPLAETTQLVTIPTTIDTGIAGQKLDELTSLRRCVRVRHFPGRKQVTSVSAG